MIVLERRIALYLFGAAAMGLAPFLFLTWQAWPPGPAYLPVVVAAEFLIYLLFAMISTPAAGWAGGAIAALTLLVLRIAVNIAGAATLALGADGRAFGPSWMDLQYGNPISIGVQMLFGLFYAPYLLYPFFPNILTPEAALAVEEAHKPPQPLAASPQDAMSPIGGFIQVYNYAELTAALRQTQGLEAFVLYGTDGRVLCSSSNLNLDENLLASSALRLGASAYEWAEALRFGMPGKILLETPDHAIYNVEVNEGVRLALIFSASALSGDAALRIGMLGRTAAEFLRSHGGEAEA